MSINRNFVRGALVSNSVRKLVHTFADRILGRAYFESQAAPAAKTTSTTLTSAELLGRLLTGNQGAAGAAAYTLPLGADLETAMAALCGPLEVNDSFDFTIANISTNAAEIITLTTNTGWTLTSGGDMTIAPNIAGDQSSGTFRVRRTGSGTFTAHRL